MTPPNQFLLPPFNLTAEIWWKWFVHAKEITSSYFNMRSMIRHQPGVIFIWLGTFYEREIGGKLMNLLQSVPEGRVCGETKDDHGTEVEAETN